MNLIPWTYRWLAVTALAVALTGFGWIKGAGHVQAQWDAAAQQQTLQAAAARERQAQATVKVVTQYVDRVRVVCPFKPMLLALSTVALCACTTLPPPVSCPSPPEMLMRPPQTLRSLPSPEPLPPTTRPATRTPSN